MQYIFQKKEKILYRIVDCKLCNNTNLEVSTEPYDVRNPRRIHSIKTPIPAGMVEVVQS